MKKGTRVNVTTTKGLEVIGVVSRVFKNNKVSVTHEDDGTTHTYDLAKVFERKEGRRPLDQVLTPSELKAEIGEFMTKLTKATHEDDGTTHTYDSAKVFERKAGRRPLNQVLTPSELKAEIGEFMTKLTKATNEDDKKRLRRLLRRRGHTGGLGIRGNKAE